MGHQPVPLLAPLPPGFATTVAALHRVAEEVLAPARKPDNEIALTVTPGGFGTPEFAFGGVPRQVRVDGDELVHRAGDDERRTPLQVDRVAATRLADWYAFAAAVLGDLVAAAAAGDAPTPPILWPEHFDLAIELGSEAAGRRANYGFSPGDEHHPEPYAYVGPWTAEVSGPLWNAAGFRGAELPYRELLAATDQRATALLFLTTRKDALR